MPGNSFDWNDLTKSNIGYSVSWTNPVGIYFFNIYIGNIRTTCEVCSKLRIKTLEWRHWGYSVVFNVWTHFISCPNFFIVDFGQVNVQSLKIGFNSRGSYFSWIFYKRLILLPLFNLVWQKGDGKRDWARKKTWIFYYLRSCDKLWIYLIDLQFKQVINTTKKNCVKRSVKSVRIWCFPGPYFPAFRLNTERYSVSLRIRSECRKIRTRKTTNTNTAHTVKSKLSSSP